jgi:hypothetical protein
MSCSWASKQNSNLAKVSLSRDIPVSPYTTIDSFYTIVKEAMSRKRRLALPQLLHKSLAKILVPLLGG